ncbi:Amidase 2 domain containing protein, partial [Asbolus verrucosus]
KCPSIISRSEWNARRAKTSDILDVIPPPFVVVHHSEGSECSNVRSCKSQVKGIQNFHMNSNGWKDIAYNFLIGGDGSVYEGRGWEGFGIHCPKYNGNSIGICLLGNFMNKLPPTKQLDALKDLIACAKEKNYIASDYKLIGHRQGKSTDCPGDELFKEIKKWPHFDSSIRI